MYKKTGGRPFDYINGRCSIGILAFLLIQALTFFFFSFLCFFNCCMQDNMKLMDDMAALRPTIFCSVPRLYNRIYAG